MLVTIIQVNMKDTIKAWQRLLDLKVNTEDRWSATKLNVKWGLFWNRLNFDNYNEWLYAHFVKASKYEYDDGEVQYIEEYPWWVHWLCTMPPR